MKSSNSCTSNRTFVVVDSTFDKIEIMAGNSMYGVIKKRKTKTHTYEQVFLIESFSSAPSNSPTNSSTLHNVLSNNNSLHNSNRQHKTTCLKNGSPTKKKKIENLQAIPKHIQQKQPQQELVDRYPKGRSRMLTLDELLN